MLNSGSGRQPVKPLYAAACLASLVWAGPVGAAPTPQYVEGDALVLFKSQITLNSAHRTAAKHSAELKKHFDWLSARRQKSHVLLRSKMKTTAALIAELRSDPDVELAEPNFLRWPNVSTPPNDSFFPQLWGLHNTGQTVNGTAGKAGADIAYLEARALARTSATNAIVAVIDTGIDFRHPDLISNLWSNSGEIGGNGIDDDGNGYIDDVHGYNVFSGTADISDGADHGTHVAGTIAATVNNAAGVAGVNGAARLMAIKAATNATTGSYFTSEAVIEAVNYATMMRRRGHNVVAINASFGGSSSSSFERTAIDAAGDEGIILCAAAGNDGSNNDSSPFYPANYTLPNIISVAASDQRDRLATFSNYGENTVDLAAPGVNIFSSLPTWLPVTSASVRKGSTTYSASGLSHAGFTTGVTGMIYNCELGYATNFPPGVSNNIALIKRGTLFFSEKVANAMAAGAKAAIIYNHDASALYFTLGSPGDWIPTVAISKNDGQSLIGSGLPGTGVVVNAISPSSFYQYLDGTSMAAPHVSGAVAFAADNFPNETVNQRIQRIVSNVTPVSNLDGKVASGGRLNLARMVDTESDGLPDWWEQQYFGGLSKTPDADSDRDDMTNLEEFNAGTNPASAASVFRISSVIWSAADGGFLMTWPSVPGRTYQVQYSDSPAGPWLENLPNSLLVGQDGQISLTYIDVTAAGVPRRFYRARLVLP